MHWLPIPRNPPTNNTYSAYDAPSKLVTPSYVTSVGPSNTISGDRVAYYPDRWPTVSLTPEQRFCANRGDTSWYTRDLREPPKMSQKKRSALGQTIKQWHSLSARDASRRIVAKSSVSAPSYTHGELLAIFKSLPASRRRAVAEGLRTLGAHGKLESTPANLLRPVATLLARRVPGDLRRDIASAEILLAHWWGAEFAVAPALLAWLERLSQGTYKDTVTLVQNFLTRHQIVASDAKVFFRVLVAIGSEHLGEAFNQVNTLMEQPLRAPEAPLLLLRALAHVPYEERALLTNQIQHVWRSHFVSAHALAVPALLIEVAASERADLSMWLGTFFRMLESARPPRIFEFFSELQTLPHARRATYLQALAGCLVAAKVPTHRPCDIALATLWLYHGHIDHRLPLTPHMELRLSNTVRACMDLSDPAQEAPVLIAPAKALASQDGDALPDTLEAMAKILVTVPQQHCERFATVAIELSRDAPGDADRILIAQLLATHPPESWSTLLEVCWPLRHANLYPGLVAEGVQTVLRVSTQATAKDVCAMFLKGGLAEAAQRHGDVPQPTWALESSPIVTQSSI